MSGICGFINLDGRPVEEPEWRGMFDALSHRGPDGGTIWQGREAVLGHQMMRVSPESFDDIQPWHNTDARLVITTEARLDNRGELCLWLGLSASRRRKLSDSQLILLAWQCWGESCPERLAGSFAFAVWDEAARRLFCCRDPLGRHRLFYFCDGRRFIFASEARAILAAPEVPTRLNAAKLIVMARPEAHFSRHEQTFYQGIYSLPAGASLVVTVGGLCQRIYWTPDDEPEWPYTSDKEALEVFRSLMDEAVRANTRSAFPVGALLSGGLDSAGVVSVAARSLAAEGRSLTTFSAVLPEEHAKGLSDEREFIDQFREWRNITLRYITDPERGPFDDLERITLQAESPFLTSRHYLYAAFAQAARESGIRVLLTGNFGEWGPTSHADGYYAELFLRMKWGTLVHELIERGRLLRTPIWLLGRSLVVAPLVRHAARQLTGLVSSPMIRLPHSLTPEFVVEHLKSLLPPADEALVDKNRMRPDHRKNQRRMLWALYRRHSTPGAGFAGYEHVEMRSPFTYRRLLSFCLAAPGRLKVRDGYTRYLIRAGLDGILPEKIQWRTCKQPFSPDYDRRYAAQRARARAILNDIAPHDPVRAIVDVERLRRLIDQATPDETMHVVPAGIYLIFFLRQFSDFRR